MSDEAPTCGRCGKAMRHDTALVCAPCVSHLAHRLELVARIAGDITLTVARLDVVTRSGSGQVDDLGWVDDPDPRRPGTNLAVRVMTDRSALEPFAMPSDLDRAQRHDAAVNELAGWARIIGEERGVTLPSWHETCRVAAQGGRCGPVCARCEWLAARHPLAVLAGFLGEHLEWLRHHPAADQAIADLIAACDELERVIDTHAAGEIQGLCVCGSALYGPTCKRCGPETIVAYTRADLAAVPPDRPVTASEAASWIAQSGLVADTGRLRKLIWAWADRGHITAVDETPRYRFGDVLDRVMASPALRVA